MFEGQIAKGEVRTLTFKQSLVPLPLFNSSMSIGYAFFLDPKGPLFRNISTDRFVIHGRFGNKITLKNRFVINIGGISGYSKQIGAGDFREVTNKKETAYYLKNTKDVNVVVSTTDELWIYLKDIDLDLIQKNKWAR